MEEQNAVMVELTAEIVSSYLSNNKVEIAALPELIRMVNASLIGLSHEPAAAEAIEADKLTTAQIKKSIRPDGLVSFLDGKSYSTLKRHLTRHGLTPDDYKERFGLPASYPMTAPDYSAKRSAMALSMGLGRKAKEAAVVKPKAKAPRKAAAKSQA